MTSRVRHRNALLGLLACACGPGHLGELPGTDGQGGTGDDSSGVANGESGDEPPRMWSTIILNVPKEIDVLVVVDDSGSMGPWQGRLAAAGESVTQLLEAEDVDASYRFAFTTTDVGNPACGGTSSERGAFVASSCVERLEDFTRDGIDASATACQAVCAHDTIAMLPTATELDPTLVPRPWIERTEGGANVAVDMGEAFACLAPQGIAGCGFTSPLEAATLALARARDPEDPAYGFLRERASLFVVVVTDGHDCSYEVDSDAIFRHPDDCPNGELCTQVFWTDPDGAVPTPGLCWNAGVGCTGAEPGPDGTTVFESCEVADKGLDGAPSDAEGAVLVPVSRYADVLWEIRQEKSWLGGPVELIAIAGYPIGEELPLEFATSSDLAEQLEYGIAPTCGNADGVAVPPVRLHEVVSDDDDGDFRYSICSDDYAPAFNHLANTVRDQIRPACVPQCAADREPSTPTLEVDCEVREQTPYPNETIDVEIPSCSPDGQLPSSEVDTCWIALVDREASTADDDDDLSEYCVEQGSNLEVRLVRRPGHPAVGGTNVEISCARSSTPELDCPGLE
ncbi:MAG: VWA domain-containing protein [Deltaproteobacteria bacterium]|nr:VWA domain-containing protein [Nannocystaceae bacterium]